MTRKLKRYPEFDFSLQIKKDDFIDPPREMQKNWLLNRTVNEIAHDIYALNQVASKFVPGSLVLATEDRTQAKLDDLEIMEDWQIPIMQAMAKAVSGIQGTVLEIGFGRGIASGLIQECGVKSHTIIECNDSIVDRFLEWKKKFPDREINIVHGLWQDMLDDLPRYDGILFHTYPLKETEFVEQIAESITFAEHFFSHAAAHLNKGGVFTYLSNEIDSLSRAHQRSLLRHFSAIEISLIEKLDLPEDVNDQWWADSMVTVKVVK